MPWRLYTKARIGGRIISMPSITETILEYQKQINWMVNHLSETCGISRHSIICGMYKSMCYSPYSRYGVDVECERQLTWDTVTAFILIYNVYGTNVMHEAFQKWAANDLYGAMPNPYTLTNLFFVDCPEGKEYVSSRAPMKSGEHCSYSYVQRIYMKGIAVPTEFQSNGFIEFLLDKSAESGYADNLDLWAKHWEDTLTMQREVYGEINDKYPADLAHTDDILAFKMRILKKQIDHEGLENAMVTAKRYEGKKSVDGTEYILKAPTCRQDIIDEAMHMNNCVASYIARMAQGKCIIMFLREAKNPDASCCTVEICNGSIVQFRGKRNRTPKEEQRMALEAIAQKVGLEISRTA